MAVTQLSSTRAFDCEILRFSHTATSLRNLPATFSVIVPPSSDSKRVPLLIWLSGLTCTDENFIIKAGAAAHAAKYGIAIVCPDTSPRGANVPGENESWEFGLAASYYVDATQPGWEAYQMATYIMNELSNVVDSAVGDRVDVNTRAISGHSMGGLGALGLAFRNQESFVSVSAFAPIAHPVIVPFGEKAYSAYLGPDREKWKAYDPTCIMLKDGPFDKFEILVDQGDADAVLPTQLKTDKFIEACESVGQKVSCLFPLR